MSNKQIIVSKLYDAVDEGLCSWKHIAVAALSYMSEQEIEEMLEVNEIDVREDLIDEY